jgi:hypothetical protein
VTPKRKPNDFSGFVHNTLSMPKILRIEYVVITQLSLLQFREALADKLNYPVELSSYESAVLKPPETQTIKAVLDRAVVIGHGDRTSLL